MSEDPDILKDYEGWLHSTANRVGRPEEHDDLVQEGRVAMWRALETFDRSRGSLPSWITRAAETRMKDLAWGHGQPTGHQAVRGVREVEMGPSLDGLEEEVAEALLGHVSEAYHDGEVLRVIRELPEAQREYVFLRFWGGLDPTSRAPGTRSLISMFPVLSDRSLWSAARKTLQDRLQHLAA